MDVSRRKWGGKWRVSQVRTFWKSWEMVGNSWEEEEMDGEGRRVNGRI